MLVATATLSAYAIWEATNRGDEASAAARELEVTEALLAQQEASLQAKIAFDLRLLPRYATTVFARDALLAAGRWEDAAQQDTERRILSAYFQLGVPADADLYYDPAVYTDRNEWEVYDPEFVADRERFLDPDRLPQRSAALDQLSNELRQSQARLMWAALAFAASLAAFSLTDLTSGLRRLVFTALAMVTLMVGLIIIAMETGLGIVLVVMVGTALYAGLFLLIGRLGARRPLAKSAGASWWAEVLGAVTIVALAAVALGLAASGRQQAALDTDATVDAAEAGTMLREDLQDALDDLDAATLVQGLHARMSNQAILLSDENDPWATVPDDIGELLATVPGFEGLGGNIPHEHGSRSEAINMIVDGLAADPDVIADHLASSSSRFVRDTARAALQRAEAGLWGEKARSYTLALVILGLTGYLLSLASNRERHPHTASWLLTAGAVGLLGGVFVSATALGSSSSVLSESDKTTFASAYAAGRISLSTGDCDEAIEHLQAAVEIYEGFGPAHADLAYAGTCDTPGMYLPAMPSEQLKDYVDSLTRAYAADPSSSALAGNLGWGHLLQGIQGDPIHRDVHLEEAVNLTERALVHDRSNPYWLLNLALSKAAMGDRAGAEQAYHIAYDCVEREDDPEVAMLCNGAERRDPDLEQWFTVLALGDLQLLEEALDVDIRPYQEFLIRRRLGVNAPAAATNFEQPVAQVFPQEVQLLIDIEPEGWITVLWYHRPPGDVGSSGIVIVPTFYSLDSPDDYLDPRDRPQQVGVRIDAYLALPPGEYWAEVFVDGHYAASSDAVTCPADPDDPDDPEASCYASPGSDQRVEWHDLGLSAVLPGDWGPELAEFGLIRGYQSTDGDRQIRALRIDNWPEYQLSSSLDDLTLAVWGDVVDVTTATDAGEVYFLGLDADRFVSRYYSGGSIWGAAGFSPYCAVPGSPGTMLSVWIAGIDEASREWADKAILSLDTTAEWMQTSECESVERPPPLVSDDEVDAVAGLPVMVAVLENDYDPAGLEPASVTVLEPPSRGQAEVTADGELVFTADPSFVGTDSLRYSACSVADADSCAEAAVVIHVRPARITDLIHAPTGTECFDWSQSATNWDPQPVEIWRCDFTGTPDIYVEYFRFTDLEKAGRWVDSFLDGRTVVEELYDGGWHLGDGPSLGRLRRWVEENVGLRSAFVLWVYEAEKVVGLAWDDSGDASAVETWWAENA
jgi:tetratricopeptide (TPR) repeat protein